MDTAITYSYKHPLRFKALHKLQIAFAIYIFGSSLIENTIGVAKASHKNEALGIQCPSCSLGREISPLSTLLHQGNFGTL